MFPFTFLFNASMTRRTRMILMTNSLTSVTTRKKSITSKDTFGTISGMAIMILNFGMMTMRWFLT